MDLRPIETRYKGYRFRSRLEARWAVFFDALGCQWQYEPEGFDLGTAGWYLPDFWLETVEMWAEVKPQSFTQEEEAKCRALVEASGKDCLLLVGLPTFRPYDAWCAPYDEEMGPCKSDFLLGRHYLFDEHRFYGSVACNDEWMKPGGECTCMYNDATDAYTAARSARFEHGERGR